MVKTYRNDALASIHETMESLHDIGAVEKQTMREFDDVCLVPVQELSPEEICALREQENMSQQVFACYLNVSRSLVSKWESGIRKPSGPALRLLEVIKKNGIQALA